jgi:hypothetical protein
VLGMNDKVITERYETEREAKNRYRQLGAKEEEGFRGKIITATYYLENTQAPHKWCVKYTVRRPER